MNYYLVPQTIAESLQLTRIRKSSAGGMFLLSEYDLQPYGIERAVEEGAMELSGNRAPLPTAEPEQEQLSPENDGEGQGETPEGSQPAQEETQEEETGDSPEESPEEQGDPVVDPVVDPEEEDENNNEPDNGGEQL